MSRRYIFYIMLYTIKFIKNPPTAEDLISLYESDLYNEILTEFGKKIRLADNSYASQMIRQRIQKKYLILNIPFDEVLAEIQSFKDEFLNFCIARARFYEDRNPDGEFAEGEELEEEEKSVTIKNWGISKTFLFDNFCEFYLLKNGDKERTLHFLKTTRMPYAKKHLSEITKIYKQSLKK